MHPPVLTVDRVFAKEPRLKILKFGFLIKAFRSGHCHAESQVLAIESDHVWNADHLSMHLVTNLDGALIRHADIIDLTKVQNRASAHFPYGIVVFAYNSDAYQVPESIQGRVKIKALMHVTQVHYQ